MTQDQSQNNLSSNTMSHGMNPNQMSAAMLRAAQQQAQQQQQQNSNSGLQMMGNNPMAMLQQQQGGGGMNADQGSGGGGLDIQSELKRIQQLHQFGGNVGAPSNALLMSGGSNAGDQQAFLQSMIQNQQKVQAPRFDNPLSQNLGPGMGNPLLQPGSFLQDPTRFLMAQNQLGAAMPGLQEVPLPSPHSLFHRDGSRRMRGGVIEPFPEKLHRLLTEVEAAGRSDVISFVANGRAFAIHKPDKFFKEIVPLYFRQSRLSSFKRQLNLYGFELINSGPARGGYFHELFVKEHPELCRRMRRVAVKIGSKDANKDKGVDAEKGTEVKTKQEETPVEKAELAG